MLEIFHAIIHFAFVRFRGVLKWALRHTTRLCELQRICYGTKAGAPRTLAVEYSLSLSRNPTLRELPKYQLNNRKMSITECHQHAINAVLRAKKINFKVHNKFVHAFMTCVGQTWGYEKLVEEIEELRKTAFSADNLKHEDKLMLFWKTMLPDMPLEGRFTKQWQHIGFQGEDPKTDFRGMGILGLDNLIYFAQEHSTIARRILSRSHHPKTGYAFAIVGINITHLAYTLVKEGLAKTHMYNFSSEPPTLRAFHQLYCYLFVEFDRFWLKSKPNNIMDFSLIKGKFEIQIRNMLKNQDTVFRLSVKVDNL